MQESGKNYKRIVVKIGASLLFPKVLSPEDPSFLMERIVSQLADLVKEGREVVIVSSGAIASGMRLLKMKSRPAELSTLQATAAVGQHLLMNAYRHFFERGGLNCAQVLLTWDDFGDRRRYLNARNTLSTLLELKVVPIVNENDTVSTEEIKFGDNDRLSALVAGLISADILIILSDVDGLLDKEKKVIPLIDKITPQIKALACPTDRQTCVGGMVTKLEAAKIAIDSGISCLLTNGRKEDILRQALAEPEKYGTLFLSKRGLDARKRWIGFGSRPKGRIFVDEGAKKALLDKKSLLSVGVVNAEGDFDEDDIVTIQDLAGNEFARGKISLSCRQLEKIKGRRYPKEIIHCDNIVIL